METITFYTVTITSPKTDVIQANFRHKLYATLSVEISYSKIGGVNWFTDSIFIAKNGDTGTIIKTAVIVYDIAQHL